MPQLYEITERKSNLTRTKILSFFFQFQFSYLNQIKSELKIDHVINGSSDLLSKPSIIQNIRTNLIFKKNARYFKSNAQWNTIYFVEMEEAT